MTCYIRGMLMKTRFATNQVHIEVDTRHVPCVALCARYRRRREYFVMNAVDFNYCKGDFMRARSR